MPKTQTKAITSQALNAQIEALRDEKAQAQQQAQQAIAKIDQQVSEAQTAMAEVQAIEKAAAIEAQASQALKDLRALAPEINKASAQLVAMMSKLRKLLGEARINQSSLGSFSGEVIYSPSAIKLSNLPIALIASDNSAVFVGSLNQTPGAQFNAVEFREAREAVKSGDVGHFEKAKA